MSSGGIRRLGREVHGTRRVPGKSWAVAFTEHAVPRINEERFSVLSGDPKASRPNVPVNIIVGALSIKECSGAPAKSSWSKPWNIEFVTTAVNGKRPDTFIGRLKIEGNRIMECPSAQKPYKGEDNVRTWAVQGSV